LELIERALLGGARGIRGTDLSAEAVEIARENLAAAKLQGVEAEFACRDFRDYQRVPGLGPETVSLLITNPPMGRRVPIPDLRGLIQDLFAVAAIVLKPGGRLVFANPVRVAAPQPSLELQSRREVDFGGFTCRLEVYLKRARHTGLRQTAG
jgi:tRNA G10  N-methylase Trm11